MNAPTPSSCPGGLGRVSGASWPQALLLAFHPSLGNAIFKQFYLLMCLFSMGLEREPIASCPPVTLFTLMFTAPQFSIASKALPLPANGELTVSTGLRPIEDQRLYSKSLPPASFSSICSLPWNQQAGFQLHFLKQEEESLLGRGL